MPLAGFEPTIPEIGRVQTYTLDRTATGIGIQLLLKYHYRSFAYTVARCHYYCIVVVILVSLNDHTVSSVRVSTASNETGKWSWIVSRKNEVEAI
jgi:hypothetical protein